MTIRENKFPIHDLIPVRHVLLSVSDKGGLPGLVGGLKRANPHVMFYSTGGTGKAVRDILGSDARRNYTSVEDFIGMPETEGGLVKTLHPKIHAGLLCERGNPSHEKFVCEIMKEMTGTSGVYFDVAVVNFYPFDEVVRIPGATPEMARSHIDVGGPTMVSAAAKNWHSVAVLSSPIRYEEIVRHVADEGGTRAEFRFELAQMAMNVVASYRGDNARYFSSLNFGTDVAPGLNFVEAGG